MKLYVQIDDGTEALLDGALDYESAIREAGTDAAHHPRRRRYLHALHRRHHGPAEGRDVSPRAVRLRNAGRGRRAGVRRTGAHRRPSRPSAGAASGRRAHPEPRRLPTDARHRHVARLHDTPAHRRHGGDHPQAGAGPASHLERGGAQTTAAASPSSATPSPARCSMP